MDNGDDLESVILHELYERYSAVYEERSQELIGDLENWRPTGILNWPRRND